jgi:hypothetical protein
MWEAHHIKIAKVGRGFTVEEAYYDLYGMRPSKVKKINKNKTKVYVYGQRGL